MITLVIKGDGTAAIESIGSVGGAMEKLSQQAPSLVDRMKASWMEFYAKVELVKQALDWAKEFRELNAKAEQSKQTMAAVANSYGYDVARMEAAMKTATKGIIDDSDLAQQALRGMMLGLDQDQIVTLMEAARPAARVLGVEYKQAMEMLITAVGGGVRAMGPLVQAGLITKDMFKLLQQAEMMGIETQGVYNIVVAQAEINMARMGDEALNTWEKMQKTHAQIEEIKETIGGFVNDGMARLIAAFQGLAAIVLEGYAALKRFGAGVKELWGSGTAEQIAEMRADALAAEQAAGDLYRKSASVLDQDAAKRIKQGIDVEKRQKEIDDYKAQLQGLVDAQKNSGKDQAMQQAMLEWQKQIDQLNPDLDETAKKITALKDEAVKLRAKWGDASWISEGLTKGLSYMAEMQRREILLATEKSGQAELEARIAIENKFLEHRKTAGEVTEKQVLQARMENDRKVLEGKQALIGTQISLEVNEAKQIELAGQYWGIQQQINALAEERVYKLREIEIQQVQKQIELEKQRIAIEKEGYGRAWQAIMDQANLVGGEMGKGLGMIGSNLKGMTDIAAGNDPYTQEIERLRQYYAEKEQLVLQSEMSIADQELAIAQMKRQFDMQEEQMNQQQKLQMASNTAGMMAGMAYSLYVATGQHNKTAFAAYKAFAIAQTIIDTYKAAVGAYSAMAGIPIVGPALGVAAAAAAITFGLARVAAISSMQPGGGASTAGVSGGGGYSYTSPTVPTWDNTQAAAEQQKSQTINVHVYGNVVDQDQFARELVPAIQKALEDGAH